MEDVQIMLKDSLKAHFCSVNLDKRMEIAKKRLVRKPKTRNDPLKMVGS